ncbi:MAG TPA: energy-coupling factor transporter ATPase [Chloroflexi bacterium]|jgi:energy-coupling factor transport system ATP-binding protein|nr:energy-coupling factor transporter ATPase [Chloroflexota bacterium]
MAESLIRVNDLHYTYGEEDSEGAVQALCGVSLTIERGDLVAIVGHNGSGKSTLAKCLNGLLRPTQGEVWVNGLDTRRTEALYDIRATVGMVFQNPDNQFVAATVQEEIAFGPENLGIPHPELRRRVDEALEKTGLGALRERNPRTLSAGQKARLAIGSILAMRPACLVLDESTAYLDPLSRREVLDLVADLHHDGLTVVIITHYMEEVVAAQRVIALEAGRIALQGMPRDLYAHADRLAALGLALPAAAAIAYGLRRRGLDLPEGILTTSELVATLTSRQEARHQKVNHRGAAT